MVCNGQVDGWTDGWTDRWTEKVTYRGGTPPKKLLPKKVCTKLGSTKIIFIDRCTLIFQGTFYIRKSTSEQETEKLEFNQ